MIRVVTMTLVRRNDRGRVMDREEADQGVADEVGEEVNSRGEVMHSEKNDWQFLRMSGLVGEQD